jgi:hypothetical protein
MYSLGSILAYDRILVFEGVYSQIEDAYSHFGTKLIKQLREFGDKLDDAETFFRYDRILLGDAITERENGKLRLCSFLKFKDMYEDPKLKSALLPARRFVERLPSSPKLEIMVDDLFVVLDELAKKTGVESGFTHVNHRDRTKSSAVTSSSRVESDSNSPVSLVDDEDKFNRQTVINTELSSHRRKTGYDPHFLTLPVSLPKIHSTLIEDCVPLKYDKVLN